MEAIYATRYIGCLVDNNDTSRCNTDSKSFERYTGYDEYIYGSAIVRFLKAAEKYSGYDISGIKAQVEDKRIWFKNTYPEFYELEVPQDKPFFLGGVDDE